MVDEADALSPASAAAPAAAGAWDAEKTGGASAADGVAWSITREQRLFRAVVLESPLLRLVQATSLYGVWYMFTQLPAENAREAGLGANAATLMTFTTVVSLGFSWLVVIFLTLPSAKRALCDGGSLEQLATKATLTKANTRKLLRWRIGLCFTASSAGPRR